MNKMNSNTRFITEGAVIAALYVCLTLLSNVFSLANGPIQVRLSEALCILPAFTPAAVPGLFLGCLISNLITGALLWDVIFGSLATLIGAYIARLIKNAKHVWLISLPTVLSNCIIVPLVLMYAYKIPGGFWYFFTTVGIGEIVSCTALGSLLYKALYRHKHIFESR